MIMSPGLLGNIAATSGSSLLDGSESDGTNILTGGQIDFSSGWTTIEMTSLTANNQTSPAGTLTAARALENAVSERHGIYLVATVGAGTPRTYSVYAKQNTRRYMQMYVVATSGTGAISVYFDLQAGTVTDSDIIANSGSTAYGTPTIAAAVNGYYKCTIPTLVLNGTAADAYVQYMCSDVATYGAPLSADNPQFTGNTSNGLDLWRPKVT